MLAVRVPSVTAATCGLLNIHIYIHTMHFRSPVFLSYNSRTWNKSKWDNAWRNTRRWWLHWGTMYFLDTAWLHLDENRIFGRLKSNSWRTVAQRGRTVLLRDWNPSKLACWSCSQSYPRSPRFILGAFAKLAKCPLKISSSARPSFCLYKWNNSRTVERIFLNFDSGGVLLRFTGHIHVRRRVLKLMNRALHTSSVTRFSWLFHIWTSGIFVMAQS